MYFNSVTGILADSRDACFTLFPSCVLVNAFEMSLGIAEELLYMGAATESQSRQGIRPLPTRLSNY